jgi:hypothetical protein
MPSTFDPLLRLELQAVGENENTWGVKANTVFELLAKSVAGHLSIDAGGSGNLTLTTNNGTDDEARYDFISLTGTLVGNRTIIIPSSAKSYTFRRATTGDFTLSVKTAAGNTLALVDGINRIACDGTNCYPIIQGEPASTDYVDAEVSTILAGISSLAEIVSANSTDITNLETQVSINTIAIGTLSAVVSNQTSVLAALPTIYAQLSAANTFTAPITFAGNGLRYDRNQPVFILNAQVTSTFARLLYTRTSLNRWSLGMTIDEETGTNAGSNFIIRRWDDAGDDLGAAIRITRSNGRVTVQERLVLGADGVDANDAVRKSQLDALSASQISFLIRDEKSAGTAGGTFLSGDWRTRDLNTKVWQFGCDVTVASNQFIVNTPGVWLVHAQAPSDRGRAHRLRLQNITKGATVGLGNTHNTGVPYADSAATEVATLIAVVTVSSADTLELQHRCGSSRSTTGFGRAANFDVPEYYAHVRFTKIG